MKDEFEFDWREEHFSLVDGQFKSTTVEESEPIVICGGTSLDLFTPRRKSA